MSPSSIVIIVYLFVTLVIVCLLTFFLKHSIRKYIWWASGIILILVIGYLALLLPSLVEWQTNNAIVKLNTFLTTNYPNESWKISDTDDYKLRKSVELHVRFDTESDIVYSYHVTDEKIEQIDFWSISENENPGSFITSETEPLHLEKK